MQTRRKGADTTESPLSNQAAFPIVFADTDEEPEFADDGIAQIEETVDQGRRAAEISAALPRLPERERRILELCYFRGLSIAAAGRVMGVSKAPASRLHARAVEMMREILPDSLCLD